MQEHMALIAFFVTALSAGSLSLAADNDSMTEQQNMQSQPATGMQMEQQQDAAKQEQPADQRDISPNESQRAMSKQLREHPRMQTAPAADPASN